MFFVVTQLTILSSAIMNALTSIAFFAPYLETLPMLIIISVVSLVMAASYPMMILLRLKIICKIHFIVMCIPVAQALIWIVLRYFLIKWQLTGDDYYFNICYILQPTATTALTVQSVAINVFFIIVAKRKFEKLVDITAVAIVNIIVILIECALLTCEFIFLSTWNFMAFAYQIKARLELSVLVYIIDPHRRRRSSEGSAMY